MMALICAIVALVAASDGNVTLAIIATILTTLFLMSY